MIFGTASIRWPSAPLKAGEKLLTSRHADETLNKQLSEHSPAS